MKFSRTILAVIVSLSAFATAGTAQASHYDGIYHLSTFWERATCADHEITLRVKNHRFDFRDGGGFRYKGSIADSGTLKMDIAFGQSSGFYVRGKAPKGRGLKNARVGELFWTNCGVGLYRIMRLHGS